MTSCSFLKAIEIALKYYNINAVKNDISIFGPYFMTFYLGVGLIRPEDFQMFRIPELGIWNDPVDLDIKVIIGY